ncbi:MAG: GDP-mannose 4,6-dehydratase [Bacteroidetes bacterium]|nr:GDP-mannose 4,6-dehydratase [Bacteroidota bacterium]
MKKALITGITGQDGAYLSKFLIEKGYQVFGIIRNSPKTNIKRLQFLGIDDRVELIPASLLDLSNILRILKMIKPDEIYNLASQSSVGLSYDQPIYTIEFNTLSTLNMLEAIRLTELETRFYQASSSEMYGQVQSLPVTEDTPFHPVSPYGVSKASAHWICVNYRKSYGLFCCCGILFNHESVLRQDHFVTKKIISTAVRISNRSREKLALGNIKIARDWGYAPKYVKEMWNMLNQETPDDYIIATGKSYSLEYFVETVFSYLGLNWKEHTIIDKKLYRPSELENIFGNTGKAKRKLGWKYNLSFENLIATLIKDEIIFTDHK